MERPRSEQADDLELEPEAPVDDPRYWRAHDPDLADNIDTEPAEQMTAPGGGGAPGDEEPTEIADDAGTSYPGGPEHQAVRIEEEP